MHFAFGKLLYSSPADTAAADAWIGAVAPTTAVAGLAYGVFVR